MWPTRLKCQFTVPILSFNCSLFVSGCLVHISMEWICRGCCIEAYYPAQVTSSKQVKNIFEQEVLLDYFHFTWAQLNLSHLTEASLNSSRLFCASESLRHRCIYTEESLQNTLYHKACTKHFPVLLCTTPMQHSCSHYNAFCSITWQTPMYLRTWQHKMTTIMQAFQCNLQPEIPQTHRTTHTHKHTQSSLKPQLQCGKKKR